MESNNEIAQISQQQVQSFNYFDANQFATMQRLCKLFSSSEIVPEMYRVGGPKKNTEQTAISNCMIAIETAQRIGASPIMVMQNMNIIYGRPSWSAKFLTATVNTCGKYDSIKYKFRSVGTLKGAKYTEYIWNADARAKVSVEKTFNEDIENIECIAFTTEKATNEVLESVPVTILMALEEGWFTKAGSKWKTMPRLMLQYRAVSFWTNAYAPELSMGFKTTEEYTDYEEIPVEVVGVKKDIREKANKTELKVDAINVVVDEVKPENEQQPGDESNPI